jgi:hypothetical protein
MIKLSIIIDDEAYEQAKLLAEEAGLCVAEWIEDLIEETCEADEEDPIAALEARVAAIEKQLQRREAAKEEATEVDSGSQEDEARSHATEELFKDKWFSLHRVVSDGVIQEGDYLRFCSPCGRYPPFYQPACGLIGKPVSEMDCIVFRKIQP